MDELNRKVDRWFQIVREYAWWGLLLAAVVVGVLGELLISLVLALAAVAVLIAWDVWMRRLGAPRGFRYLG